MATASELQVKVQRGDEYKSVRPIPPILPFAESLILLRRVGGRVCHLATHRTPRHRQTHSHKAPVLKSLYDK